MTIQITRPEVEALIHERLASGPFTNAEDVILDALRATAPAKRTGADIIAAMKQSPFQQIDIEPSSSPMPVRDVTL